MNSNGQTFCYLREPSAPLLEYGSPSSCGRLAPENISITVFNRLGDLPHFNPDLEGFEPPSVIDFRSQIREADGVLIASPEYAHGITGVLKNGLDWVVGSGEFVFKPVALLNASPRAVHAQEALREVLKTMDARLVDEASLIIPLPNNRITEDGILDHSELASQLSKAIALFACAIKPELCLSNSR